MSRRVKTTTLKHTRTAFVFRVRSNESKRWEYVLTDHTGPIYVRLPTGKYWSVR